MTSGIPQGVIPESRDHNRRGPRGLSKRVWLTIIAATLFLHLLFILFFKTEYVEVFRKEIAGDSGSSEIVLLDRPFSLIPYPEDDEPAVVPEPAETSDGEELETTVIDDLGEPALDVEPIRRSGGGGSSGRPGPRRSVVEPKPLFIPWPAYPDGAPDDIRGNVELLLYVGLDGIVKEVRVARGLPHEALNRTAVEAARRIRFIPGEEKGVPTAMWVRLSIGFQPR